MSKGAVRKKVDGEWFVTIPEVLLNGLLRQSEKVKNLQAEIDTLSMAHDNMHRLIDRDKHFLIKSNIALNNKIKELEDAREADIEELGYVDERLLEAEQQNKRYREALEFYANEEKWIATITSIGDFPCEVEKDQGKKARKALEEEEK